MILTLLNLIISSAYAIEPIKIAVVDTGLDLTDRRFANVLCPTGHKDFTNTTIRDLHGHGTHIAGLIKANAGTQSGYCLIILKFYDANASGRISRDRTIAAFAEADRLGADIINLSGGGPGFDESEYLIMRNSQALFVLAAGNDGKDVDFDGYYPAAYHLLNSIVVGNMDTNGKRVSSSNFGSVVTAWEIGLNALSEAPDWSRDPMVRMTGTSQAAAVHSGRLARLLKQGLNGFNKTAKLCFGAVPNLRVCRRSP